MGVHGHKLTGFELSPEQTRETLLAAENSKNQTEAAYKLGLSVRGFQKRLAKIRRKHNLGADDPFPIIPGKSVLYDAQSGEEKLIWATGKGVGAPTAEEVASQVREALDKYKPPKALKTAVKGDRDLLCVWPLPDLHVGMRAWGKETGGPDWDLTIANKVYRRTLSELAVLTPKSQKAVMIVLGDLMHSDNYQYKTTNPATNHIVDQDGRYPKVLVAATDLCIYSADVALQRADQLEIVVLPGNHDGQSAIAISLALEMYFKNNKRVKVHMTPGKHWFHEFGRVMLAATHGDKCKPKDMPGLMAAVQPEMWGRTKHRIVFTGHLHHEEVKAYPGCKVETLAAPCPPDSWTAEMGFHSARHMQTRVFHREKGERFKQIVGIE